MTDKEKLQRAREVLAKWRAQCVLPEFHKELIRDTEDILREGVIDRGLQVTKEAR